MRDASSEKIEGAFSIIIQGMDAQGREVQQILTHLPAEWKLDAAIATGHLIAADEVRDWFRTAGASSRLPDVPDLHVRSLAHQLNILRVTGDISEAALPRNPQLERVKRALQTLVRELPTLIEGGRQSQTLAAETGRPAAKSSEQQAAVEKLYEAVLGTLPSFYFGASGKRRQPWHDAADLIASAAIGAWRAAGSRPLGVGKATSPAVIVTGQALARIGVTDECGAPVGGEAISQALVRRRRELARFRALIETRPLR